MELNGHSMNGGAAVHDDCRAVCFSAQRHIDDCVCVVRLISAQSGVDMEMDNTSAEVVNWNARVQSGAFTGEASVIEDGVEVRPASEANEGCCNTLRMVYHYKGMSRGDYAVVGDEVAALWLRAGIARRVSREEYDSAVAMADAHASESA